MAPVDIVLPFNASKLRGTIVTCQQQNERIHKIVSFQDGIGHTTSVIEGNRHQSTFRISSDWSSRQHRLLSIVTSR